MSGDLSRDLQAAYDHAAMRALAQRLKSSSAWASVRDIQNRHEAARQREKTAYRETYDARVAEERRVLLRKRGQLLHEPRKPAANARFGKSAIDRQAHRNVRFAHRQSLARIDAGETEALKVLVDRAGLTRVERPRAAFAQTRSRAPKQRRKQRP